MNKMGDLKVVFLGAGNMAEALVRGLLAGRVCAKTQLTVTDLRPERLTFFTSSFGVSALSSNTAAVAGANVIFLAVKPQQLAEAVREIAAHVKPEALIISIAAGVRTRAIEALLSPAVRVVRAMPNTPALVGAGVTAICPGQNAGVDEMATAEVLLKAVGFVVRVEEEKMDAVTAVSGSGPAYVFAFMEALLDGAQKLDLPPELARQLVYGTLAGSLKLAVESDATPATLRERVTSKGGTTAAALEVIRERNVARAWVDALAAAKKRSVELSEG